MNTKYYVARMPQELRSQIEAETVYYTWLKQGETLESILNDPDKMHFLYSQLSVRERKVLMLIVRSIGCESFDTSRLEKLAASGMSGADAKVGFLQLVKKGLIFPFRKSWGEHVYVMSLDGLGLWQRVLFPLPGMGEEPLLLSDEGSLHIQLTESNGPGLAHDLFQALVFIAQNDVKWTKNGTINKRQLQKLSELLTLPDPWLEGAGMKYAYVDIYSPKIAFLMELLTRLELLEGHSDGLLLHPLNLERWLSLSEKEQNDTLYAIWKQAAFPGAVWLQHAVSLLERSEEGGWIRSTRILDWLSQQGLRHGGEGSRESMSPFPLEDAEALLQLERQWIYPLIAFGWMEKGTDSHGVPLYRWIKHPIKPAGPVGGGAGISSSEEGEDQERFYVQPDFELLVPPEVGFAVRWELSVLADLHKSDQVSLYKLSKESLQRAMEHGRRAEEVINFLERYSLYGVPENIKLTIAQWAKPFGKVGLAQVVLLRCLDEAAADAVRKLPGSGEWLLEPVGQLAWIVKPDQVKKISEALTKAGWMPGKIAQLDGATGPSRGTELLKPDFDKRALSSADPTHNWLFNKGFIYSRHGLGYFEMEPRLPEIRDLYPDLNGIPTGWVRDYRAYHVSTRREMVEKAMEWRAGLQVRYNGQDHLIAPRKLQETRGTWSMTGLEQTEQQEVCWFPEEWQEMKMILPGINDKY
ncbi:helicase-associated domain-containing protein [Paenibacillus rigui]|uniref:Helicase XPB/Ssl2 N-terminal domain-containing protein n=1 Tax=Paenibacillus rigui TaxID=554312 RepID=A0A229UQV6_9BACL|nr:helicase-associated domain-containing protein [Paenibacillus rigui]OXM85876.1 hypothetical protein CF651_11615 [Paenibacillus rigui]